MTFATGVGVGRWSNQRQIVLEAVVLAGVTGRTLLLPPLTACPSAPLAELFDFGALAAAGVDALPAADYVQCAQAERVALASGAASEEIGGVEFHMAGLPWRVQADFSGAVATMPPPLAAYAAPGADPRDAPVYAALLPYASARVVTPAHFGSAAMPAWLQSYRPAAAAVASCALLAHPFFAVNLAALPGAFEAAVRALQPAPWLAQAASAWLAHHALAPHRLVAVHVRLTDMANDVWSPFAAACVRDARGDAASPGAVPGLAALSAFLSERALESLPVVVASDDLSSPCAQAVLAHFSARTRVVVLRELREEDAPGLQLAISGHAPDDCSAFSFMHEILAQSAAFIGMRSSTFSAAVHQIRELRHGHANSTLLLD